MTDEGNRYDIFIHSTKINSLESLGFSLSFVLVDEVFLSYQREVTKMIFLQIRKDICEAIFDWNQTTICSDFLVAWIYQKKVSDEPFSEANGHLQREDPPVPAQTIPIVLELSIKTNVQTETRRLNDLKGWDDICDASVLLNIERQ